MKKEIRLSQTRNEKRYTTKHMYKFFLRENPELKGKISKKEFTEIIRTFNKDIVDSLISGYVVTLPSGLGALLIKKVKRDYSKPTVNMGETKKARQKDPNAKPVYYTDPYYFRFSWRKVLCRLKNKVVYRFDPTQGPNGNTRKMSHAAQRSPNAQILYHT